MTRLNVIVKNPSMEAIFSSEEGKITCSSQIYQLREATTFSRLFKVRDSRSYQLNSLLVIRNTQNKVKLSHSRTPSDGHLRPVLLLTNREGLKKEEMIAGKSSSLWILQKGNALNTPGKLTGKLETLHSASILAWKIPWTEEPGRLQSMGSQRVGHD